MFWVIFVVVVLFAGQQVIASQRDVERRETGRARRKRRRERQSGAPEDQSP